MKSLGSPVGAGPAGCEPAQGALVGAIGPGGSLEVSGRADGILDVVGGPLPALAVVHGAAVPADGGGIL